MRHSILDLLAKRTTADVILGEIGNADSPDASATAGRAILHQCQKYGVSVRDYLNLTIEPEAGFTGYEMALLTLNMPVRDDFANGMVLQAAAETFQTRPGTKILFKEVIDDIIQWKVRLDNIESASNLIANSRTIDADEMTIRVELDDGDSENRGTRYVPEGARIPVRSITSGESKVRIFKHGSAIRTTYEFGRNVRLDVLTPFLARIARELEISKAEQAVSVLVNGDGNNNAAPVVAQSQISGVVGAPANTAGQIQWHRFFRWLMDRAAAGVPIDTVVMNYDAFFQWTMLFGGTEDAPISAAEQLGRAGISVNRSSAFDQAITPVLSSFAPAGKLVGFSRAETLEELTRANSNIEEEERNILNQTITMTKTENTGYRLVFSDTRSVYDFAN